MVEAGKEGALAGTAGAGEAEAPGKWRSRPGCKWPGLHARASLSRRDAERTRRRERLRHIGDVGRTRRPGRLRNIGERQVERLLDQPRSPDEAAVQPLDHLLYGKAFFLFSGWLGLVDQMLGLRVEQLPKCALHLLAPGVQAVGAFIARALGLVVPVKAVGEPMRGQLRVAVDLRLEQLQPPGAFRGVVVSPVLVAVDRGPVRRHPVVWQRCAQAQQAAAALDGVLLEQAVFDLQRRHAGALVLQAETGFARRRLDAVLARHPAEIGRTSGR